MSNQTKYQFHCLLQKNGAQCHKVLHSASGIRNHQKNDHHIKGPPYNYEKFEYEPSVNSNDSSRGDSFTDSDFSESESEELQSVNAESSQARRSNSTPRASVKRRRRDGRSSSSENGATPPTLSLPVRSQVRHHHHHQDMDDVVPNSAPDRLPGNNNARDFISRDEIADGNADISDLETCFASVRNHLERIMSSAIMNTANELIGQVAQAQDEFHNCLKIASAAKRQQQEMQANQEMLLQAESQRLEDEKDAQCCCICAERPRTDIILPCGHFVLCRECTCSYVDSGETVCPICKAAMITVQRVYYS